MLPTRWRLRILLPCLLAVLGCEPTETEPVPPDVAACTDYCGAAEQVGCPQSGSCMEECLSLFDLGCEDALVALLSCAGPALGDDCVPRADDGKQTCVQELQSYNGCIPTSPLDPGACSPSTAMSPGGGDDSCAGALTCDGVEMTMTCDEAGSCQCLAGGQEVGTCEKPILSAYLCSPHASCCAPFFFPE